MSNADIGELIYKSYITFRRESRQRELAFSTDVIRLRKQGKNHGKSHSPMSNDDIGELIYKSYITFRRESRQGEFAFSTEGMGLENKEKFTEKAIHLCQTPTSVN